MLPGRVCHYARSGPSQALTGGATLASGCGLAATGLLEEVGQCDLGEGGDQEVGGRRPGLDNGY